VFDSIDSFGRDAYRNQPRVARWNLARLAECLLPLPGEDQERALASAQKALAAFRPCFEAAYLGGLWRKIGLSADREGHAGPVQDLLRRRAENGADFTLTFRRPCNAAAGPEGDAAVRALFADAGAYDAWVARWRLSVLRRRRASLRRRRASASPSRRRHRMPIAAASAALVPHLRTGSRRRARWKDGPSRP
jgi:serine/tyrosine/threonine adenylyltransferase